MAEIEKPVPMRIGLRYVEVCADQRNEERVEEPVDELEKYLRTLIYVRLGHLCVVVLAGWAQPGYVRDLGSLSIAPCSL